MSNLTTGCKKHVPSSREGLREKKNVNRKLQKLKDQIKAEKLAKKISKLGGSTSSTTKNPKIDSEKDDDDEDDDDGDDDLLVLKARHEPESSSPHERSRVEGERANHKDDNSQPVFSLHEVSKSRHAKTIRLEGSTSQQNRHVVFDDNGEELQQDILSAIASENKNRSESAEETIDLAEANEEYLNQVRERLERTREQDKADEKSRIREKHRKKRIQDKSMKSTDVEGQEGNLLQHVDESNDSPSAGSSSSSDDSSTGDEDGDNDIESVVDVDVTAQEDLALTLIRGGRNIL